jgi:hypothetical protein
VPGPDLAAVRPSAPALLGLGSGIVGAAAVLVRTGSGTNLTLLPSSGPLLGFAAVPVVSLLALVGPTGLTFPCWAVDAHSPGVRLWRWVRSRLPS